MTRHYPEGVSSKDFDQAVRQFESIVGSEWVFTDEETELQPYLDRMFARPPEYRVPSAAVAAASVEEIRDILAVCRQYHIPIWTTGNGRNWAYGGPAVKQTGYVNLDLKRMNRILEVNEELAYCVVEPGVSYFQLYHYIQEKGYKLWIDCAAPGWGGVIGNAHEHGAGYTPYGDHHTFQVGSEIMLSDGSLIRTGPWAMTGSKTPHIVKYGYGPFLDGTFTQGNYGITTKAGFWLMPEPPAYRPFLFTYENESDLHAIIEAVKPLKLNNAFPNGALIEHISYTGPIQVNREAYTSDKKPLTDAAWQQMARDIDMGIWNLWGALYGTEESIAFLWNYIEKALTAIPGAKVYLERPANDTSWNYREKLMRGEPNMTEFGIVNWRGGGHINLASIMPCTGRDAVANHEMMKGIYNKYGFDYMAEYVVFGRLQAHLLMVMFDPRDAEEAKLADECSREIILASARLGYGEMKAHLEYMDLIAGTYNANDNGLNKLYQKLKDTLDPAGILSPGKSGIWPGNWQHSRN